MDLKKSHIVFPEHIVDVEPIGRTEHWMALTETGVILNFAGDSFDEVGRTTISVEPSKRFFGSPKLKIVVSLNGGFAAVSTDFGRYGEVFDLAAGRKTMDLDAGDYLNDTVKASIAFVEFDGRTVLIHRTDWNRLDISDPETGKLITERESPEHDDTSGRYLDYFHGGLSLSPDMRLVADDGWVWHPLGVPTIWSVDDWLNGNVWESECGASKLSLCARSWYWNHSIAWINNRLIAIEGIGDDKEDMADGVRIFDVQNVDSSSEYGDVGPVR